MKLTHPLHKVFYTLSAVVLVAVFNPWEGVGATLTIQTNKLGTTPDVVGINFGHWFTGSNTRAWWSYCGASGGRIFISPSILEPTDSLAPVGDGVTDQASFVSRKAALRADPLNPLYINWNYITNQYETVDFAGSNHYKINSALREARQLGINILRKSRARRRDFLSPVLPIGLVNGSIGITTTRKHFIWVASSMCNALKCIMSLMRCR